MIRCLAPKSDADVRSLLRGDDLNPVECRLRPVLLGGCECMPDRSYLTFICSPCGLLRLRGGGRRSWVKLRTIVGSFGARFPPACACWAVGAGSLKSFPTSLDDIRSHRQLAQHQRHQLEHHINHPLRKSTPPSNSHTLPSTTPPQHLQ